MKREQLLDAIGGIDERFLREAEQTVRPARRSIRRFMLVAAIVAAFTITAMASTELFAGLKSKGGNGATNANLSTGMSCFVYADDGIYYGVPGYIYKCDTEGNVLKTYKLSDELETPNYMFATEDAIVYVNSTGLRVEPESEDAPNRDYFWGLRMQPKDGSAPKSICPGVEITFAYADGDQLYTNNGGTMLSRIDLMTLEQTDLLEDVSAYFVDDTYIYAIQSGSGNWYFRSRKDAIRFEQIHLDFDPNKVIADGEDLYFCQWFDKEEQKTIGERYRVNLVRDGVTTPLPVYTWFYQVLDGCVLYREEGTYDVKCYDPVTGETRLLQENVFEFAVLEGRYICFDLFNEDPVILDWETGEYVQIPINK